MDKPKTPDGRNIIDYYYYWDNEAILADLDSKRHNFTVLASNIQGDFNIGTVIRNANAFLAKEVIIYGRKKYDRRGTVGTHTYTHFRHVREVEDLTGIFEQFGLVVGIDNIPGAKPIETYQWNHNIPTLMCFGQEHVGLPKEILDKCHDVVYISQYGSVRSLNVGTASGIAMYSYLLKRS